MLFLSKGRADPSTECDITGTNVSNNMSSLASMNYNTTTLTF